MSKEFIPYEEALALKELGFDEKTLNLYRNLIKTTVLSLLFYRDSVEEDDLFENFNDNNGWWLKHNDAEFTSAPTYQQAFRWFREKYGFYSLISIHNDFKVMRNNGDFGSLHFESGRYNTYQEAQDACLRKLIEIVKAKQRR